jgi:transposase
MVKPRLTDFEAESRLIRVNIPKFNKKLYRKRNLVERFFNKLKHFRAVATRFEKHDANYLALVKLASARIWMRFMSR